MWLSTTGYADKEENERRMKRKGKREEWGSNWPDPPLFPPFIPPNGRRGGWGNAAEIVNLVSSRCSPLQSGKMSGGDRRSRTYPCKSGEKVEKNTTCATHYLAQCRLCFHVVTRARQLLALSDSVVCPITLFPSSRVIFADKWGCGFFCRDKKRRTIETSAIVLDRADLWPLHYEENSLTSQHILRLQVKLCDDFSCLYSIAFIVDRWAGWT